MSLDVINSTLGELKDSGIIAFQRKHWFYEKILNAIPHRSPDGSYAERTLVVGSPARGRMILKGDEVLNLGRRNIVRKIRVDPFRWVINPVIPIKHEKENVGKGKAIDLVKTYVMTPVQAFYDDFAQFSLCGALTAAGLAAPAAEYQGTSVLNGQYTSGRVVGTEQGFLEFQAFTAQTQITENLAKSATIFHANQYRNITSWSLHGMRQIEAAWRDAARYAKGGANAGPNVILMDPTTFGNLREQNRNQVRIVNDSAEARKKYSMTMLSLDDADVCCDHDLDVGLFTGVAATGVTYLINTDGWEVVDYDKFDIPPLKRALEAQDGYVTSGAYHSAMLCANLAGQATVSGGNV
jgi:hypothetical protein